LYGKEPATNPLPLEVETTEVGVQDVELHLQTQRGLDGKDETYACGSGKGDEQGQREVRRKKRKAKLQAPAWFCSFLEQFVKEKCTLGTGRQEIEADGRDAC